MLNLTEHMKRVIQLSEQSLIHVEAKDYGSAFDDLVSIKTNIAEAEKQLWQWIHTFHPSNVPAGVEPS